LLITNDNYRFIYLLTSYFLILFCVNLQLTNIRLHNVFNDFVMLANTQFVENVSSSCKSGPGMRSSFSCCHS